MKSYLTHCLFRRLVRNALYTDIRRPCISLSHQCLRQQRPALASSRPIIHHAQQRRSLFGFSRNRTKKPKPASFEPGHEILLRLSQALKMGVRPPPPREVAQAFRDFVKHARGKQRLQEIQADLLSTAYIHLEKCANEEPLQNNLSREDLGLALFTLKEVPNFGTQSASHIPLSEALFSSLKAMYEADAIHRMTPMLDAEFQGNIMAHLAVLAYYGKALEARDLAWHYWESHLKKLKTAPWRAVIAGFIREGREQELEALVANLQVHGISIDPILQQDLVRTYSRKGDFEQARRWYKLPLGPDQKPTIQTVYSYIRLCVLRKEFEVGDVIFKTLLEDYADEKLAWDLTVQWAAAKGRGVDEIDRMMDVNVRRNKCQPQLHPDICTINVLARHATAQNDPYTAERYISLGKKRGYDPDANTYLIQLDYRLKVGDLAGAMVAYSELQSQDLTSIDDVAVMNSLTVAFCEQRNQNYDTIMALVDDLTERKGAFTPATVAALSKLHLQRGEVHDLQDLVNTHATSFGLPDRDLVRQVLVDHILDLNNNELRAWKAYKVLLDCFGETLVPVRTQIMQSFFARHRSDMGTHVFAHMRQAHISSQRPTVDTYSRCLQGIARAGDAESLETVHNMAKLDNEIEFDTQMNTALMLGHIGCGQSRRALEFWEDIVLSREGPTYESIQTALRACERAPLGEREARKIWKRLESDEIEVTGGLYAAYLGALAGQGLFDQCVNLCAGAEAEGFGVNALLLGTFFNATAGNAEKQKVKQWAWEMYPNPYEELMKCGQYFIIQGDPDDEVQQYREKEIFFDIAHLGRFDIKP